MASLALNNTAKAILLALLSTGLLTACGGGGGGTTRGSDSGGETPTPETTYKLTVSSPTPLKNASVRVITLANKEIGKGTIADGSTITFTVKASDTKQIMIAEISPKDNASFYYDVTLNKYAPFNTTLHRMLGMTSEDINSSVDPFSEVAYQRALVRSGSMDQNSPDFSNLTTDDIINSEAEVLVTFGVGLASKNPGPNPDLITLNRRSDYTKLIFTQGQPNPFSTRQQYENAFFAAGHYWIQRRSNPADTTPYLTFAKKAAEDMRDGSLDGLTIFGDGTDGKNNSYSLNNGIVAPAPLNTDPALNKIKIFEPGKPEDSNTGTMKGTQKATRVPYAEALKFNTLAFMNSLSHNDTEGLKSFTEFKYADGYGSYQGNLTKPPFGLHSFGAGNYKRAFGIEPIILAKGKELWIKNKDCIDGTYVKAPADKDIPVLPECVIGVNVQGEGDVAPFNTIQALVGKYSNTDSCKLTVSYNGLVSLSKGSQTFNSTINRGEFDAIIHTGVSDDDHSYVLNVASADATPLEIIQLKVVEQKVVSAAAGFSDTEYPKALVNPQLSCTFQYN